MSDWYVSSVVYATFPQFAASHAYNVGDIIVPTTGVQADGKRWVLRCTTAGISGVQPTWGTDNNSTTATGAAVFTNVTGQSTYFWAAASGDIMSLTGQVVDRRVFAGHRIFVSSDHTETFTARTSNVSNIAYQGSGNPAVGLNITDSAFNTQILSVDRAGSTPPVDADLLPGATVTCSTASGSGTVWHFESSFPMYYYGMFYIFAGSFLTPWQFLFNVVSQYSHYFDNCRIQVASADIAYYRAGAPCVLILNNTTVGFGQGGNGRFTNTGSAPAGYPLFIQWQNTTAAITGTQPLQLFENTGLQSPLQATLRGVDLSSLTGSLTKDSESGCKILLDSCHINPSLKRYSYTGLSDEGFNQADEIELVNCFDGTNILSERYTPGGKLLTETSITLVGGARDDVGYFSHKIDTSVPEGNVDQVVNPFCSFWMDVENILVGNPVTATVEIVSSTTLNNDEIALYLQYEGTPGSSYASFANSFIATVLSTPVAVTASAATWNSYPATPVTQKCQVTFTPQHAGRLRGQIRVGIRTDQSGINIPIYINPQITVT